MYLDIHVSVLLLGGVTFTNLNLIYPGRLRTNNYTFGLVPSLPFEGRTIRCRVVYNNTSAMFWLN
jgi:hypothetical protein